MERTIRCVTILASGLQERKKVGFQIHRESKEAHLRTQRIHSHTGGHRTASQPCSLGVESIGWIDLGQDAATHSCAIFRMY